TGDYYTRIIKRATAFSTAVTSHKTLVSRHSGPMLPISVVVLTFNAEATIAATLASARRVSDDVHVVDSGSTDRTLELSRAAGAQIAPHPCENYGAQRNGAIENLRLKGAWELPLAADERVSDELGAEIGRLAPADDLAGYYIPRLVHFH